MAYVRRYVPSGIVTEEVLADIEKAKVPLVKIYHYHVNHLGTPQELTNQDGDVIWLSYDRAWGGSFDSLYRQQFVDNWAVTENELQPFKFQGQCLDTETGLHYNRFRYYDSDVGMFISRDPIGLLGGSNVFQYAPNPIGWIDPWGLNNEVCVFGNKTEPKGIRDRDLMPNKDGILPSQEGKLKPEGKSATRAPEQSNLTGHYHKIDAETQLPEGLAIKHDGRDLPGGYMSPGHSTIYPTKNMTPEEFNEKLLSLPWSYGGKIENK